MTEVVTFPAPPDGFEYCLVKKSSVKCKDPSELTPRQLATLKYNQKNREKINEKARMLYSRRKKEEEKQTSKVFS